MSAFGPKRTLLVAPHMSAFGGKADMTGCACLLSRSLLGVKRTSTIALHMSAYDPKRTSPLNSRWSAVEPKTKEAAPNTSRSLGSDRATGPFLRQFDLANGPPI